MLTNKMYGVGYIYVTPVSQSFPLYGNEYVKSYVKRKV